MAAARDFAAVFGLAFGAGAAWAGNHIAAFLVLVGCWLVYVAGDFWGKRTG